MNILTQVIDNLDTRYRSAVAHIGTRADEYAHACLRTLEQIRDAVTDDEATHRRVYIETRLPAGVTQVMTEKLPHDAEWQLEAVTLRGDDVTALEVFDAELDVTGGKLPRFATKADVIGEAKTVSGNDVFFTGGADIVLVSTLATMDVRLQFKVARMKTKRMHSVPGRPRAVPDHAGEPINNGARHAPQHATTDLA